MPQKPPYQPKVPSKRRIKQLLPEGRKPKKLPYSRISKALARQRAGAGPPMLGQNQELAGLVRKKTRRLKK